MTIEKATYSESAVLDCRDRIKEFDWTTDKKSKYTWERYRGLQELFEFCYQKTGCLLFADGWGPFGDFSKAMSGKPTKKDLDRTFKACERYLKQEITGIWQLMQSGEVNKTA